MNLPSARWFRCSVIRVPDKRCFHRFSFFCIRIDFGVSDERAVERNDRNPSNHTSLRQYRDQRCEISLKCFALISRESFRLSFRFAAFGFPLILSLFAIKMNVIPLGIDFDRPSIQFHQRKISASKSGIYAYVKFVALQRARTHTSNCVTTNAVNYTDVDFAERPNDTINHRIERIRVDFLSLQIQLNITISCIIYFNYYYYIFGRGAEREQRSRKKQSKLRRSRHHLSFVVSHTPRLGDHSATFVLMPDPRSASACWRALTFFFIRLPP